MQDKRRLNELRRFIRAVLKEGFALLKPLDVAKLKADPITELLGEPGTGHGGFFPVLMDQIAGLSRAAAPRGAAEARRKLDEYLKSGSELVKLFPELNRMIRPVVEAERRGPKFFRDSLVKFLAELDKFIEVKNDEYENMPLDKSDRPTGEMRAFGVTLEKLQDLRSDVNTFIELSGTGLENFPDLLGVIKRDLEKLRDSITPEVKDEVSNDPRRAKLEQTLRALRHPFGVGNDDDAEDFERVKFEELIRVLINQVEDKLGLRRSS